jgi:phthiocerol/phenolphthiocerol synthesis type-I polyketide synthase E
LNDSIAIIGMSGRFPGARNVAEFWRNLSNGVESISTFTEEELTSAGVPPSALNDPNFVKSGGVLQDIDLFDAHFFGLSARDAEIMDPQQRLFLECAWEGLEDAGYNPEIYPGSIGVYAGTSMSTYAFNIYAEAARLPHLDHMQVLILNDKDHLTTHVSYKLNLRGPSMAIQTACSTSLVAVCTACDALWNNRCDMALAGGTAISIPQRKGYHYQPGGILSPDGHCRAFDATGKGTLAGNGIGVVVLKATTQALRDRDHIYAVIKGAAVNNDGNVKVGYTAPSIEGQAKVVEMAQKMCDVPPDSITYVEAHGTATKLGDPIEIAALTQAFRKGTEKKGFCAIGSVKTNIGHLDPAAGVAGLIKTALSLEHRKIPPSLHYRTPNPDIDFANSPFYVNTKLVDWSNGTSPLRAGVSSFGIGGTNAHCVLEEAPVRAPSGPSRPVQLLPISARSRGALDAQSARLAQFLRDHPDANLADVAHVYQTGRKAFLHRRIVQFPSDATSQSVAAMLDRDSSHLLPSNTGDARERPTFFLFSGQGTQYIDMARQLYQEEALFHERLDECFALLGPHTGFELRDLIFPSESSRAHATAALTRTSVTQPALFAVEYALAHLWMSWGITPQAMLGHSIGEYVAACLAGVFELSDAIALVALRGALVDSMPAGAMLAVPLSETEALSLLHGKLSLAAVNGPSACVISGHLEDIEHAERQLASRGLLCRRLTTSHAFHSGMMDPAIAPLVERFRQVRLSAPRIPYVSNVTGTWITSEEATNPEYWGRHLRQTVRFSSGVRTLLQEPDSVLLEIGPGRTLSTLARMEPLSTDHLIISSLPTADDPQSDIAILLASLGRLWLGGATVEWSAFSSHERRHRLSLPTYPFEGQRYWIGSPDRPESATQRRPVSDWFYTPVWSPADATEPAKSSSSVQSWLLVSRPCDLVLELTRQLKSLGHEVTVASPEAASDLELDVFQQIVDLTLFGGAHSSGGGDETGFWNLLGLAKALGKRSYPEELNITIAVSHLHAVQEGDRVAPYNALVLGLCRVIPEEYAKVVCRSVDLPDGEPPATTASLLIHEILSEAPAAAIAWRDRTRWTQSFEPIQLKEPSDASPLLRKNGVYLVTGGLGGIGFTLAKYFAKTAQAKLVLVGRSGASASKLQAIREMEEAGAEVMVVAANAANRDEMEAAVSAARSRFGSIDGVVHSAGVAGGGMIQLKSREVAAGVLAPKVDGAEILLDLLSDQPLKFFVICSSLASIYGGFGQVDYCAANNFLDAFAQAHHTPERPVISIGWDTWRDVGMAVNTEVPPELQQSREESLARGIAPKEGIEAFLRILNAGLPHVAVCTTDLQASLQENMAPANADHDAAASYASVRAAHPRPPLATPHVAPRTETEETIAGMWQDLLGVAPIGVNDNFFELGGHSLLAVQVISQFRSHFEVEMTVQSLFDQPTVAKLAAHVDSMTSDLGDLDTMARLLEQVENLSEGEISAMLSNGRAAVGNP